MAGLQYTFMLPPNLSFPPKDIPLGSLLPLSDETKLPDPSLPIVETKAIAAIDPDLIRNEIEEPKDKPWRYAGKVKGGMSAGFAVQLPFISPVDVGFDLKHSKGYNILIECSRVETLSFIPSNAYISKALQDDVVKAYTAQFWVPSVFLVTGVKIATNVKITHGRSRDQDVSGSFQVDLSSVGAPISVGPHGGKTHTREDNFETERPGPLILAYQLKRIRPKKGGSFKATSYNESAVLYSATVDIEETPTTPETLEEFWDIEDVAEGTDLSENIELGTTAETDVEQDQSREVEKNISAVAEQGTDAHVSEQGRVDVSHAAPQRSFSKRVVRWFKAHTGSRSKTSGN